LYRILAGKSFGKRPLGRPTRRLEDNIKMDIRADGRWIELAQNRVLVARFDILCSATREVADQIQPHSLYFWFSIRRS
jgi:hypothetical protein